jgi:hypothetical protein
LNVSERQMGPMNGGPINLANADLTEAVLDGTDFARTKLAGANLCGANLSKVRNLTEAQLAEGVGDSSTILPQQLKAPDSWTATTVEFTVQPVTTEATRAVTPIAPRPRSNSASRVSWLVGGPLQTA